MKLRIARTWGSPSSSISAAGHCGVHRCEWISGAGDVPRAMRWLAGLLQTGNRLRVGGGSDGQDGDGSCELLELGHHIGECRVGVITARHDSVNGCVEVLGGGRGRGGWPGI